MKKLALVSVLVAALFGALAVPALSQTSDTIEVTMSPQLLLSVIIDQEAVDYGTLALSPSNASRTQMPSFTVSVRNTGNAPTNLVIAGSDATSTLGSNTWVLNCDPADMGTVGMNQYVHRFWESTASVNDAQALCSDSDKELATDVQPWTEQNNISVGFRLQLNMPTGTTGYGERTSTVTVTAVQP